MGSIVGALMIGLFLMGLEFSQFARGVIIISAVR
jgi:hypothetical protein